MVYGFSWVNVSDLQIGVIAILLSVIPFLSSHLHADEQKHDAKVNRVLRFKTGFHGNILIKIC